jgi:acyl-CoA thioesterase
MTTPVESGLEQLKRLIQNRENSGMWELFNLDLTDAGEGWAVVEARPEAQFNNHMMRTHGGFAATLIDSALGSAVMTKVPAGTGYGTIELKVNYVRKLDVTTGVLQARATVLHSGRTMLTAECKVVDTAGVLYAHGSGTFLVYPK